MNDGTGKHMHQQAEPLNWLELLQQNLNLVSTKMTQNFSQVLHCYVACASTVV